MKKTKIKYKGKLKSYMQWPVVFLVIMAIMNVVSILFPSEPGSLCQVFWHSSWCCHCF